MRLAIRNARIIDPASGRDGTGDLYIADGKISEEFSNPERVIDAKGLVAAPGFIDLSARLGEPGFEYKATLESELEAALAGGVTSLACPPDTDPPLDEPGLVDMLRRRAKALSRARVYPIGALTVKLEGERLTEMVQLAEAGCVAFSQANVPVANTQVLWRALQYAATFGLPVWLRPEDASLAKDGVAHDGELATRLGLPGIPPFSATSIRTAASSRRCAASGTAMRLRAAWRTRPSTARARITRQSTTTASICRSRRLNPVPLDSSCSCRSR